MRQANEQDWKNVETIAALNKQVKELEQDLETEREKQAKTLVKVGELESIFAEWVSNRPSEAMQRSGYQSQSGGRGEIDQKLV